MLRKMQNDMVVTVAECLPPGGIQTHDDRAISFLSRLLFLLTYIPPKSSPGFSLRCTRVDQALSPLPSEEGSLTTCEPGCSFTRRDQSDAVPVSCGVPGRPSPGARCLLKALPPCGKGCAAGERGATRSGGRPASRGFPWPARPGRRPGCPQTH